MPGKSELDLYRELINEFQPEDEIWVSPNEKQKRDEEEAARKAKVSFDRILREYEQQQKLKPKSDVDRLRDELMREIKDIKRAINLLGIMLESEEPSLEDLQEHATLRDAYRKYKMVEALTLGKRDED